MEYLFALGACRMELSTALPLQGPRQAKRCDGTMPRSWGSDLCLMVQASRELSWKLPPEPPRVNLEVYRYERYQ